MKKWGEKVIISKKMPNHCLYAELKGQNTGFTKDMKVVFSFSSRNQNHDQKKFMSRWTVNNHIVHFSSRVYWTKIFAISLRK